VIGFAAAAIGLVRPVIGLFGVGMLCALSCPTRVYLMTGGLLRGNSLDYWLLLVALLGIPCLARHTNVQNRIMQAFVLLLAAEIVFSPDLFKGVLHWLRVASALGMFVCFVRAAQDENVWHWIGVINGVLGGAGGFVYWLQHDQLPYIDPNAWGYFPLTAIFSICLASTFGTTSRSRQFLLGLLAVVNFAWVFLTASRGCILVGACCLLYLTLQIPGILRRFVWTSGAALLAVVLGFAFGDRLDMSVNRITNLLNTQESLRDRTSGRSDLALGGWRIFLDHPLGVGTGGFNSTWADREFDYSGLRAVRGEQSDAHSAWIRTLAENGVPGIALFAVYVFSFAVVGWRRGRRQMFFGFTVTAALGAAFLSTEFYNTGLWFLAVGASVILERTKRAPEAAPEPEADSSPAIRPPLS
jgi:O-antigen ligase